MFEIMRKKEKGCRIRGKQRLRTSTIRWVMKPATGTMSTGGIYKAMQRHAKRLQLQGKTSDWLWAAVKHAQERGTVTAEAQRTRSGGAVVSHWRDEEGADAWGKLLDSIAAVVARSTNQKEITRASWNRIWQIVKGKLTGKGASAILKAAAWAMAVTRGYEVEGQGSDDVVSGNWRDPLWWQSAEVVAKSEALQVGVRTATAKVLAMASAERQEGGGAKLGGTWMHFCSGDGDGIYNEARSAGKLLITVDIKKFRRRKGIARVVMDLTTIAPRWWILEACRKAGVNPRTVEAVFISPPCETYSHSDPSNKRWGQLYNYRDHEDPERPPAHLIGTKKGNKAVLHDHLTWAVSELVLTLDLPWWVENPQAYLQCRPHMARLDQYKQVVHYCAFWSSKEARTWKPIKKPTNIWTNIEWAPCGCSRTGQCPGRNCKWRIKKGPRKGHHESMEGAGTKGLKGRHPQALIAEWVAMLSISQ